VQILFQADYTLYEFQIKKAIILKFVAKTDPKILNPIYAIIGV
jgi:hypothetical protein